MKIALKIVGAIVAVPVAYIIFENALATFIPSGIAAVVAIIASLTLGVLIVAPRKK